VKAFRCGEYEECIENAKLLVRQQKRTYNEGKYVRREDAIMHALEIERSRFPDEDDAMYASQNTCRIGMLVCFLLIITLETKWSSKVALLTNLNASPDASNIWV
jgi:hypothetical protein